MNPSNLSFQRTLIALVVFSNFLSLDRAQAASKTWTNGSADFLWNTTSANWNPSNWSNGDDATFGATGVGAISLASGISANSVTFNTVGYTINSGTLELTKFSGDFVTVYNNANATIGSQIVGAGRQLVTQGTGTLTLTNAGNSYTGATYIGYNGGNSTLSIASVGSLGTGTLLQFGNGAGTGNLQYTGGGAETLTRSTINWTNATTIEVTNVGANLTLDRGNQSSGGTLTKTGPGTLIIATTGALSNSFVVDGGTLSFSSKSVGIYFGGGLAINNNSTLSLKANGSDQIRFQSAVSGAAGTQINILPGTGSVRNDNFLGNWSANLASLDVATGATFDIRANQVRIDALSGGGSIINSYYQPNSGIQGHTLTVGVDDGTGDFSGTISGTGTTIGQPGQIALVKTGSGIQTLSGNNTYAGTTAVNSGTLRVNGSHTGGALYTVASIAALGGNGTITAPVTLNGVIAPGNSVGMLTTGNETWNNGATFHFEINDADGGAGSGWDLLTISGAGASLTLSGGTITVDLDSLSGSVAGEAANFDKYQSYDWLFVDAVAAITTFNNVSFVVNDSGFMNDIAGDIQNGMFSVVLGDTVAGGDNTQLYLHYQAAVVPEPSTWKMSFVGMLALGLFAWRQRVRRRI
jgi:fibronectin-binding autotransporter adhesin